MPTMMNKVNLPIFLSVILKLYLLFKKKLTQIPEFTLMLLETI